ncbi:PadR family transcriptional regulator [Nocardioides anomalus]|uniref:PadR family transcriptional regulator n=1 Tax=Nocardioides anomalus TaxID=2712223 RepID=A0A6G6W918_9ACTN|nr:PadR family transcriptional regulator [Nocardioides anomalus]QIG41647.1 PadR family transcriptional regulator [Nocardioides anomalus]
MSAAMVLLGLLGRGPGHGYELKVAHDAWFPAAKPLAFGQVYASLGRLERDGLVETVEVQPGDGPERTVYALTDAGRAALDRWLAEPEQPVSHSADDLVRKTVTALRLGVDHDRFLDGQHRSYVALMRELTRERTRTEEPGARIALDHRLAHLDADLRWLAETRERVRGLAAAGGGTTTGGGDR